jgi:deazaflavin-dependent oxidoreductase (nitroreductase family)
MRPPRLMIRLMGRAHAAIYRRSGGARLSSFGAAPVLLLTTTGRRTGKERTVPLLYVKDGEAFAIVGSMGGHDSHPAWVHNLRARPQATVQVGDQVIAVNAREADPDEVARLWLKLVEMYPAYADYRARTSRRFPVVLLMPGEPRLGGVRLASRARYPPLPP